jgi:hypothetical protein
MVMAMAKKKVVKKVAEEPVVAKKKVKVYGDPFVTVEE